MNMTRAKPQLFHNLPLFARIVDYGPITVSHNKCLSHLIHSPTSKAAAEAIEPKIGSLRRQVLDYLRHCGVSGATDDEMQLPKELGGLDMDPSTQRPRRIELVNTGWVRDSGKRRKTRSGRLAVVWEDVLPSLRKGREEIVRDGRLT